MKQAEFMKQAELCLRFCFEGCLWTLYR